ncbi:MAG: ADP-ribosylglycohydrolase family protein [Desulfobacterales bacterium]|nr:ADP-ribosylglycohydrolase family protein [Deltaproteobacteria bacterium]NNK93658.1 ADP-ribosylglycohydrolase family protein [Desulfobacterales bacterium]
MGHLISFSDRVAGALFGMFIGDALAMPVHWYYNTQALQRDYGEVTDYCKPRNPHPDSILWRSSYIPASTTSDILHDQAQYWGQRGIHYHQFLQAGENTLNVKLAGEVLDLLQGEKSYDAEVWLDRLIAFMTTPGTHKDTYVEEYLRHFFTNYGNGMAPLQCGRTDEKHIGGLTQMLPVAIRLAESADDAQTTALQHLALTHGGSVMEQGGNLVASIILDVLHDRSLADAISHNCSECTYGFAKHPLESLLHYPDQVVVGRHFSSACYMEHALPAILYLAVKYPENPERGLIANTMCGGDNAGRGAILGALLGAENGIQGWPQRWLKGLLQPPLIEQLS